MVNGNFNGIDFTSGFSYPGPSGSLFAGGITKAEQEQNIQIQQPPSTKRERTKYSESQLKYLEGIFKCHKYPQCAHREEIANRLHLTDTKVQIWFKNRRAKDRQQNKLEQIRQQIFAVGNNRPNPPNPLLPEKFNRQVKSEAVRVEQQPSVESGSTEEENRDEDAANDSTNNNRKAIQMKLANGTDQKNWQGNFPMPYEFGLKGFFPSTTESTLGNHMMANGMSGMMPSWMFGKATSMALQPQQHYSEFVAALNHQYQQQNTTTMARTPAGWFNNNYPNAFSSPYQLTTLPAATYYPYDYSIYNNSNGNGNNFQAAPSQPSQSENPEEGRNTLI